MRTGLGLLLTVACVVGVLAARWGLWALYLGAALAAVIAYMALVWFWDLGRDRAFLSKTERSSGR